MLMSGSGSSTIRNGLEIGLAERLMQPPGATDRAFDEIAVSSLVEWEHLVAQPHRCREAPGLEPSKMKRPRNRSSAESSPWVGSR